MNKTFTTSHLGKSIDIKKIAIKSLKSNFFSKSIYTLILILSLTLLTPLGTVYADNASNGTDEDNDTIRGNGDEESFGDYESPKLIENKLNLLEFKNDLEELQTVTEDAQKSLDSKDYKAAIKKFTQIYNTLITKYPNSSNAIYSVLFKIGYANFQLQDYQNASEYFEQAAQIDTDLNDVTSEAYYALHYYNAISLESMQQFEKSIDEYSKCIKNLEITNNVNQTTNLYVHVAKIYSSLQQYQKAINIYDRLEAISQQQNNYYLTTYSIYKKGVLYIIMQDYPTAYKFLQNALSMSLAKSYDELTSYIYYNIGIASYNINSKSSAMAYFEKGFDLSLEKSYVNIMERTSEELIKLYKSRAEYEKAIDVYDKKIAFYTKHNDLATAMALLAENAELNVLVKDYTKAEKLYLDAINYSNNLNNKATSGQYSYELAQTYYTDKQYSNAVKYGLTAITVYEEIDANVVPRIYYFIGNVKETVKQYQKSIEYFQLAIDTSTKTNVTAPELSEYYRKKGTLLYRVGNYPTAKTYLLRSLNISTTDDAVLTLAGLYYYEMDFANAEKILSKTMTHYAALDSNTNPIKADALYSMSMIRIRLHEFDNAIYYLQQALDIDKANNNEAKVADDLYMIAITQFYTNALPHAAINIDNAILMLQNATKLESNVTLNGLARAKLFNYYQVKMAIATKSCDINTALSTINTIQTLGQLRYDNQYKPKFKTIQEVEKQLSDRTLAIFTPADVIQYDNNTQISVITVTNHDYKCALSDTATNDYYQTFANNLGYGKSNQGEILPEDNKTIAGNNSTQSNKVNPTSSKNSTISDKYDDRDLLGDGIVQYSTYTEYRYRPAYKFTDMQIAERVLLAFNKKVLNGEIHTITESNNFHERNRVAKKDADNDMLYHIFVEPSSLTTTLNTVVLYPVSYMSTLIFDALQEPNGKYFAENKDLVYTTNLVDAKPHQFKGAKSEFTSFLRPVGDDLYINDTVFMENNSSTNASTPKKAELTLDYEKLHSDLASTNSFALYSQYDMLPANLSDVLYKLNELLIKYLNTYQVAFTQFSSEYALGSFFASSDFKNVLISTDCLRVYGVSGLSYLRLNGFDTTEQNDGYVTPNDIAKYSITGESIWLPACKEVRVSYSNDYPYMLSHSFLLSGSSSVMVELSLPTDENRELFLSHLMYETQQHGMNSVNSFVEVRRLFVRGALGFKYINASHWASYRMFIQL